MSTADLAANLTREQFGAISQARAWIDSAVNWLDTPYPTVHSHPAAIADLERAIERLRWAIEDVEKHATENGYVTLDTRIVTCPDHEVQS